MSIYSFVGYMFREESLFERIIVTREISDQLIWMGVMRDTVHFYVDSSFRDENIDMLMTIPMLLFHSNTESH